MKTSLKILDFAFAFLFVVSIVNAFGYFRKDYDMFDFMGMHGFGLFMGLGIFAIIVAVLVFVFWLLMLIDCLKRDFKKDVEKIAWILVLIFLHILGAIIYYFVVKISDKEIKTRNKK